MPTAVTVLISYANRCKNNKKELELIGGFIGITQDSNKCLQPEIGWGVREKDRLSQLIDILGNKKQYNTSLDCSKIQALVEIPKEIFQLLEKFSGVTIYANSDSSWYFNRPQEYRIFFLKWQDNEGILVLNQNFTSFAKLNYGRYLA